MLNMVHPTNKPTNQPNNQPSQKLEAARRLWGYFVDKIAQLEQYNLQFIKDGPYKL